MDWRPATGQVALIELAEGGADCLTGLVLDATGDAVSIDLGASPKPTGVCEVSASFFCPDALYRLDGTLAPRIDRPAIVDLTVHEVERVQRRLVPRVMVSVPVVLSNFDDPDTEAGGTRMVSVTGTSVDLGEGGCRVVVDGRFPAGCDPTVTLHLPDDSTLLAVAAVLQERALEEGRFEYRLVFTDQEDGHRQALGAFIGSL